jgi:trk system potassium uptake protein TrkA
MKIFMVGAGQVGTTILEALRGEHEFRVVDRDHERLSELVQNYGVTTVEGDGASRRVLQQGGIDEADLFISCTPRDEVNLIACLLARRLAPNAKTIARVSNEEYLEVWRDRFLDVDFLVSSELEAALAVSRIIGIPAARQSDVFADGQVQMVEFEVPRAIASAGACARAQSPTTRVSSASSAKGNASFRAAASESRRATASS